MSALAATLGSASCALAQATDPTAARADSAMRAPGYPAAPVRAWQVGLLRPDRLQHATLSFTLAAGSTIITRRANASVAVSLLIGLAKEIRDIRHGGFDPLDLTADAAGAVLGASVARTCP